MNDGLLDAFRHNAWATRELLLACQGLSREQLDTTVPGTYGSIIETLWHTVRSEGGYCRRLTGEDPGWTARDDQPGVDDLLGYAGDLAAGWERFLAQPFDAERAFRLSWHTGQDYDVPAGIPLAQALHHGTEHRAQVSTALTSIGVTPPEMGVWEFAEATGRAKPVAT